MHQKTKECLANALHCGSSKASFWDLIRFCFAIHLLPLEGDKFALAFVPSNVIGYEVLSEKELFAEELLRHQTYMRVNFLGCKSGNPACLFECFQSDILLYSLANLSLIHI